MGGVGEEVWVIDQDGGKPRQVSNFNGLDILQMRWAPDSKHIVVNAGQFSKDVVLIRNFK